MEAAMSNDTSDIHKAHFAENWLAWSALRHLLSIPLLRELLQVLTNKISANRLALDDLFEEEAPTGISGLETWALRAHAVTLPTATYLQHKIQTFLWQNDSETYVPKDEAEFVKESIPGPQDLEYAFRLGAADYDNVSLINGLRPEAQKSLTVLSELVVLASSLVREAGVQYFVETLIARLADVEAPLSIVMVKHLGDLCADVDEWNKADALYEKAQEFREALEAPAWQEYSALLKDTFTQSSASAARTRKGAKQSYEMLKDNLGQASLKARPVLVMNATFDTLVAFSKSQDAFSTTSERRGTLVASPLYEGAHDLDLATSYFFDAKYSNAQRICWAVLRRQIALGLAAQSRTTKAFFARTIIAMLSERNQTQTPQKDFALAVRLLLESGEHDIAEHLVWPEKIIAGYVDEHAVEHVITTIIRQEGAVAERAKVAIELFSAWMRLLPPNRPAVANRMVRYLASTAEEGHISISAGHDVGGRCLDLLKELAKLRPEFRRSNRRQILSVISSRLAVGQHRRGQAAALELASEYMDVLSETEREGVIRETLSILERINPATHAWQVLRPALNLLASAPVVKVAKVDSSLGKQIVATILRFGVEEGTAAATVLFHLRDFDPQLLADEAVIQAVQPMINALKKEVTNLNSSGAVGQIQALLLSPTISGRTGVDAALGSLKRIIQSSQGRHPSMGLAYAYISVMAITGREAAFASELSMSRAAVNKKWQEIYSSVLNLWSAVKVNPLLMAPFSIPPATTPNSTMVHNWAFASMRFAESLGNEEPMLEVLQSVMQEETLHDAIAVAIAIGTSAEQPNKFTAEQIRSESAEVFYSALGQRLVLLAKMQTPAAEALCRALLQQCLRCGPRGLDAAVFVTAARLALAGELNSDEAANYVKRVEASRELRLSLLPLVSSLGRST
jgi:hypothetical protein